MKKREYRPNEYYPFRSFHPRFFRPKNSRQSFDIPEASHPSSNKLVLLSHLSKDSKLHQGNEFDRVTSACGVEETANRVNKRDTRCTHDYNILVILFSRVRNRPLREPNDLFSPYAAQPAGRPLTYLCFMLYLSRTGVPCCLLAGLCCAFHFALLVRRSCNAIVPCPLNNDRDC